MSNISGMVCVTMSDLYLQPNENDVKNGVTWYHGDLLLPSGSQVTIIDQLKHGVVYVAGKRRGFAGYEYFTEYSKTNPFIPTELSNEGRLAQTPVKKVQFDDELSFSETSEEEPSLESIVCPSEFSDSENIFTLQYCRVLAAGRW